MSDYSEVQLINLLVQCIEKMKTISGEPIETQERWGKVIDAAVLAGQTYVVEAQTQAALNDMGTTPNNEQKTFI